MSRLLLSAIAFLAGPVTTLFSAAPIRSVTTDQPVVALTFDDGPDPANTPRMLEIFARENVRVTFFEVGKNVAEHPELSRAVRDAGHEIGNHSNTHANLAKLPDIAAVRAELVETQRIIQDATGVTPVVFRAPYLAHGPELHVVLDELKLPSITGISPDDWNAKVGLEEVIARATQAGPGDIVILHSWPEKTVEALPEIIRLLREKGLRFVTVSELLAAEKIQKASRAAADRHAARAKITKRRLRHH